ncbi:MAG: hypothetical protein J7K40_12020 [candidate division Zixibacteria bacterium]|nr:hypothetical protein [candidate division Zixibacteria bacterium]
MNIKTILALVIGLAFSATANANNLSLRVNRIIDQEEQQIITVDLILINHDTLSGMQIPLDLGYEKLGFRVDSVSFRGTRCEHFYEQFYRAFPEHNKVFIFIMESADPEIDSAPLLPGTGKIATIYMTRVRTTETNRHTIANTRAKDGKRDLRFHFWNNHAEDVPVTFNASTIDLRH